MLAPPSTLLWDGAALLRSRATVGDPALHAAVDQLRADAAAACSPHRAPTNLTHPGSGLPRHELLVVLWPCTATCNASIFANCAL